MDNLNIQKYLDHGAENAAQFVYDILYENKASLLMKLEQKDIGNAYSFYILLNQHMSDSEYNSMDFQQIIEFVKNDDNIQTQGHEMNAKIIRLFVAFFLRHLWSNFYQSSAKMIHNIEKFHKHHGNAWLENLFDYKTTPKKAGHYTKLFLQEIFVKNFNESLRMKTFLWANIFDLASLIPVIVTKYKNNIVESLHKWPITVGVITEKHTNEMIPGSLLSRIDRVVQNLLDSGLSMDYRSLSGKMYIIQAMSTISIDDWYAYTLTYSSIIRKYSICEKLNDVPPSSIMISIFSIYHALLKHMDAEDEAARSAFLNDFCYPNLESLCVNSDNTVNERLCKSVKKIANDFFNSSTWWVSNKWRIPQGKLIIGRARDIFSIALCSAFFQVYDSTDIDKAWDLIEKDDENSIFVNLSDDSTLIGNIILTAFMSGEIDETDVYSVILPRNFDNLEEHKEYFFKLSKNMDQYRYQNDGKLSWNDIKNAEKEEMSSDHDIEDFDKIIADAKEYLEKVEKPLQEEKEREKEKEEKEKEKEKEMKGAGQSSIILQVPSSEGDDDNWPFYPELLGTMDVNENEKIFNFQIKRDPSVTEKIEIYAISNPNNKTNPEQRLGWVWHELHGWAPMPMEPWPF